MDRRIGEMAARRNHEISLKRGILYASLLIMTLSVSAQDTGRVICEGTRLLGVPYVAHTLETGDTEKLVISKEGVDCTTFVEYVLALSLSAPGSEEDLRKKLQSIRYRNGIIDGYTSRLHYVTEWIENGVQYGHFTDISRQHCHDSLRISLHFMSTHPELYRQLSSPQNLCQIKEIEMRISGRTVLYLPQEKLPAAGLEWIHHGDIIAITTDIDGLDIAHMGFAYYQNGMLKLLHASSSEKKVVISRTSLRNLLDNNRKFTGIRVLRPCLGVSQ